MPANDARCLRHAPRRTLLVALIAVMAVVAGAVAAGFASRTQSEAAPSPSPSPTHAADGMERPAAWSAHRPSVHLTPERDWMNDPQKPFLLDGVWHYYYLYNADYPDGNGTAWYHATSTDLVHWRDEGVAIEKYDNGLGDIWTGTAVVDHDNTAGFGAGAVIALVTQQVDGVQRQSLFFSTDGGYTFASYEGNPVMDNPGVADWRDPRVIWDDARGQWVMALAEHERIGFYTSANLREWTYVSDFVTAGLGVLECPDLFPMAVDGDPTKVRWVLAAGANGESEGRTTGTAYWVGEWNGSGFVTDSEHQWLDHGPDFYAAVTWDDPRLAPDERLASRYAIGWMNNWAYAGRLPTEEWHGGADSLVRTLTLRSSGDGVRLASAPADEVRSLDGGTRAVEDAVVDAATSMDLEVPAPGAYRLRLDARREEGGSGELRVKILLGDGTSATAGYDFDAGVAFVARDTDAAADGMPDAYRAVRTAPPTPGRDRVSLDLVVDASSVELFTGEGDALTMATFGTAGERGLRLEAERGTVSVSDATVTPLRVAPVERAAR